MASKERRVAFVLLLCIILVQDASDNIASGLHVDAVSSRKVMENVVVKSSSLQVSSMVRRNPARTAPSGPDPLHHHGNTPKKPFP